MNPEVIKRFRFYIGSMLGVKELKIKDKKFITQKKKTRNFTNHVSPKFYIYSRSMTIICVILRRVIRDISDKYQGTVHHAYILFQFFFQKF